ncbi:MAG: UDP-N-acetylmuramoyl-L-alanyl-D-glutamate--2,6-diaminopimelate ligase [Pseudomonadota bacterium]|nr:UDP-N-acetylmuramoyl-L-alanyl-D-glutamate--2,6-diaminopimelate ligase [Pseudomonadota bacterium]
MPLHRASRPWLLSELLAGFSHGVSVADVRVGQLTLDSRRVEPGGLFLACGGADFHGLDFAEDACRRGAAAILAEPDERWEPSAMDALSRRIRLPVIPVPALSAKVSALADRFFDHPSTALEVIGVTGTNGKTSVTHYLAQALAPELACGIVGTLGVGFPGDLAPGTHTTPDPVTLQETLALLRGRGARAVAMEVSSHALEQGRAAAVRFSYALFTNLSRDHLDYHGDMASYGAAKRRLFRMPHLRWAILNLDDPLSLEILDELAPGVSAAFFSLRPDAVPPPRCDLWIRAREVEALPRGLRVCLETNAGSGELTVGLLGRFNAANLMAVLAVMLCRDLPLERALRELTAVRGVAGRMEPFGGEGLPQVVVDYAHTPDALEQALLNLRGHTRGRLICVFGCGGGRDRGKRPMMGAIAERLSDEVILTDDNPRREDGELIVQEILAGMREPAAVRVQRQRALAIRLAIATAAEPDLVLVAGKGHETMQDMGDLRVHFSDRAQVVQALQERGRAGR